MDSMEEIYRKYAQYVYKYLMSQCQNASLAEELTQETFYQAIKSINRYDGRSQLSTWLVGIAKNQYLVYLRKNPGYTPLEELTEEPAEPETTEDAVFKRINRIEMLKLLHRCEEPYREILYLRMFENMSFRDIGEVMGKSENWARVTFYRGKERLKKELLKNG